MRGFTGALVSLLALVNGCGNGHHGSAEDAGAAQLSGTLAYVASSCHETPAGIVMHETLRVRHGEDVAKDVLEFDVLGSSGASQCRLFTGARSYTSRRLGAFVRLTVSPGGARVGFELKDDFSLVMPGALDSKIEGFYVVNADGSDLRKLGPPSRLSGYFLIEETVYDVRDFQFTPDGHALVFTDIGPGPMGEDAAQIFLVDVETGARRQLTRLPYADTAPAVGAGPPAVHQITFLDDATIGFASFANPGGLNPQGNLMGFKVRTDGQGEVELLPRAEPIPGGSVSPAFQITGDAPRAETEIFPERPDGPPFQQDLLGVQEIFLRDGDNLLQLTAFHRSDTFATGPLSRFGARVNFTAAADPFGTNPHHNCQLFSIDRTGGDLRQITFFDEHQPSFNGCNVFLPIPFGCFVELFGEDAVTGNLVFRATCDPLGTNPNGSQIFAIGSDGRGLSQLTNLAGYFADRDGGEGPGIYAFGS